MERHSQNEEEKKKIQEWTTACAQRSVQVNMHSI